MALKAKSEPEPIDYGNAIDGKPYTHLLTFSNKIVADHAALMINDNDRRDTSERLRKAVAESRASVPVTVPVTEQEKAHLQELSERLFRYAEGTVNLRAYYDIGNIRKVDEPINPMYDEWSKRKYEGELPSPTLGHVDGIIIPE